MCVHRICNCTFFSGSSSLNSIIKSELQIMSRYSSEEFRTDLPRCGYEYARLLIFVFGIFLIGCIWGDQNF